MAPIIVRLLCLLSNKQKVNDLEGDQRTLSTLRHTRTHLKVQTWRGVTPGHVNFTHQSYVDDESTRK